MMKLKRDPVVLLNLFAAAVMAASDWVLPLNDAQQSVLNAAALALSNLVAATLVHDGQLPALSGLAKAVLALTVGFGLKLNPDLQVTIMSAVAWLGSLWVRTQVAPKGAPTPPALAEPVVEVNNAVGQVASSSPRGVL
jgi:hypothetical protein